MGQQENDGKDPRYQDSSPHSSAEQGRQPEPERPVPAEERREGDGQADKPSQAEGER